MGIVHVDGDTQAVAHKPRGLIVAGVQCPRRPVSKVAGEVQCPRISAHYANAPFQCPQFSGEEIMVRHGSSINACTHAHTHSHHCA